MIKEALLRVGLAVTLSGCGALPLEGDAYTTPLGIVYLHGGENDPQNVLHEEDHWRMYQEDPWFFVKYTLNKDYACEAEKSANRVAGIYPVNDHPACK